MSSTLIELSSISKDSHNAMFSMDPNLSAKALAKANSLRPKLRSKHTKIIKICTSILNSCTSGLEFVMVRQFLYCILQERKLFVVMMLIDNIPIPDPELNQLYNNM